MAGSVATKTSPVHEGGATHPNSRLISATFSSLSWTFLSSQSSLITFLSSKSSPTGLTSVLCERKRRSPHRRPTGRPFSQMRQRPCPSRPSIKLSNDHCCKSCGREAKCALSRQEAASLPFRCHRKPPDFLRQALFSRHFSPAAFFRSPLDTPSPSSALSLVVEMRAQQFMAASVLSAKQSKKQN